MQPSRDPQPVDLLLDGHPWHFTSLREAVTTSHKLRGYRGAQWPEWAATLRRLYAEASAADQAWYHRTQTRQGGPWVHGLAPALAPRGLRTRSPQDARSGNTSHAEEDTP